MSAFEVVVLVASVVGLFILSQARPSGARGHDGGSVGASARFWVYMSGQSLELASANDEVNLYVPTERLPWRARCSPSRSDSLVFGNRMRFLAGLAPDVGDVGERPTPDGRSATCERPSTDAMSREVAAPRHESQWLTRDEPPFGPSGWIS